MRQILKICLKITFRIKIMRILTRNCELALLHARVSELGLAAESAGALAVVDPTSVSHLVQLARLRLARCKAHTHKHKCENCQKFNAPRAPIGPPLTARQLKN